MANGHKNPYRFDWSFGNSKLKKEHTVAFNIPALRAADGFITCPNAGVCAAICYAQQGRYTMPKVQAPRERNIWKLRQMTDPTDHDNSGWGWLDVEADLIIDVQNLPRRITQVRIHDSGDFYDREYLHTWVRVAEATPNIIFYAYTKQIALYREYLRSHGLPDNMRLVQSIGGKQDAMIDLSLPHSRIFPTRAALQASGYTDATHTDVPAYLGEHKIGLVYHGTRNLTDKQATTLTDLII